MIKALFQEFTQTRSLKSPAKETLKWLVVDPAMRKRVLVTIGAIIVLYVVAFIPLPGIDVSALREFFQRMGMAQSGPLSGSFHLLSSGALDRLRISGFGIMPFLSACLLLQVATVFVPKLRRYSFGGESGRAKLVKLTYIFTVILSVTQAYYLALWLEKMAASQGVPFIINPGFVFRLMVVVTVTASVLVFLFIADIINRYGIGNGIAIIVIAPVFLKLFPAVYAMFFLIQGHHIPFVFFLFLIVIFAALAYAFFYLTIRVKTVEIGDGKNKTALFLRSSIVGHEPIGWAMGAIFLVVSFVHFALSRNLASLLGGGVVYMAATAVFIVVFTYLYALVVFDSKYLNGLVNKYGFSVVTTDGKPSENFLNHCVFKVLILSSLVLLAGNVIPNLVMVFLKIPYRVATLFCGTSVLLGVGVFSDILHQVEFFKAKADSGIKDWAVCYAAFDEFEANIKVVFLKNKGIEALIEPLRFTWGMPVRTIVDQYRIYVPCGKREEARGLLID